MEFKETSSYFKHFLSEFRTKCHWKKKRVNLIFNPKFHTQPLIKILFVGHEKVGKSSLRMRLHVKDINSYLGK